MTGVKLEFNPADLTARVRIDFEIQPQRILPPNQARLSQLDLARGLVQRGLRAQLQSASLITGQQLLAMTFVANAPPAQVTQDAGIVVLPSEPASGIDNITKGLSSIASKLGSLAARPDRAEPQ